jgi:hypothetical protein
VDNQIVKAFGHALILDLTKQKVNTRSSTESKMVAVNNTITKLLWTKKFIEAQGHKVQVNIEYQDNTSAMKLERHGKAGSGKRACHFDINFFYFTDLIKLLWTNKFIEAQGHKVKANIVYQNSTSAIKLELKEKQSRARELVTLTSNSFTSWI